MAFGREKYGKPIYATNLWKLLVLVACDKHGIQACHTVVELLWT
jgi:hypothetical protein